MPVLAETSGRCWGSTSSGLGVAVRSPVLSARRALLTSLVRYGLQERGMVRRKRNPQVRLRFGTITCAGCAAERLLARECRDCGAQPRPHEVQLDLQRRERLVADFRRMRQAPLSESPPDLEALLPEYDRAMKRMRGGLADAARVDRTADSLLAAFTPLDQLVARWQEPLPRPHRNRGRIIGNALQRHAEGAEHFVEALRAPDIFAAQELERLGNDAFEESAAIVSELAYLNAAEETLSADSPAEALNKIGRSAWQLAGQESSLRDLDRALRAGAGWENAADGMGLQAHAIHNLALTVFDLESFNRILSASDAAIGPKGKSFAWSEEWRRRHARASAFLGSAGASVHQTISATGSSDLEIAHRTVEAVATLRDGVLRHALATILAGSVDEYLRLVNKNGGAVISKAALAHPDLLLNDHLTPALRNAGAHADIDVTDYGLEIDGTYFSTENFLDRFLAYLETTVAAFMGVTLAMARRGWDLDYSHYLAPRDRDAATALLLGAFGLQCESVEVSGDGVTISVNGPEPDWMLVGRALSAMYSKSTEQAAVRLTGESGEHLFITSLARFRLFTEGMESLDVRQLILRLAPIAATSNLDGACIWSEGEWFRLATVLIARGEEYALRDWVRGVREFRGYAGEAGMTRVVSVCDRAIAELRDSPPALTAYPAASIASVLIRSRSALGLSSFGCRDNQ